MNKKEKAKLIDKYRKANKRLVLLDYDGTLVNYTSKPETAILPELMTDIILKLIECPQTKVFIITGRSREDIDKFLNHIPINIVAEHGALMKQDGVWKTQVMDNNLWKKEIIPVMSMISDKCPQSFIEEKNFSLSWHYRNAEPGTGYSCSRELIFILGKMINHYNLKILDGNKVVEILTQESGKGKAVKKLFGHSRFDFVLSIGDDVTDEEMFEFFQHYSGAFTIKVGDGDTLARYKLDSIMDVESLLKQLSG